MEYIYNNTCLFTTVNELETNRKLQIKANTLAGKMLICYDKANDPQYQTAFLNHQEKLINILKEIKTRGILAETYKTMPMLIKLIEKTKELSA